MNSGWSLVFSIYFQLRWFKQITTSHSVNINLLGKLKWLPNHRSSSLGVQTKIERVDGKKNKFMRQNLLVEQETRTYQNIFQKHQTIINKEIFQELPVINSGKIFIAQRKAKRPIDTHWLEVRTTINLSAVFLFAPRKKKDFGNVSAELWLNWFKKIAAVIVFTAGNTRSAHWNGLTMICVQ